MTNWDNIVEDKELGKAARLRRNPYNERKDYTSAKDDIEAEGWQAISQYANPKYTKYRKEKPVGEQFEDSVWMMFFNMGFYAMNKDNHFRMVNDPNNPALTKQIDVFAVEDEIVFVIECKTSENPEEPRPVNFKTDIEALRGSKEYLRKEITKKYPNRKVVFVWASRGLILGTKDKERLSEWDIVHFDDSTIQYYQELTTHLGRAARYQLLGNILKGRTIKKLDTDVVAVEGRMGGLTYYSFLIEPDKLLKIGYVLHRSSAGSDTMDTYQRLIKRKRLTDIRKFINEGGYFPNSIVISIDSGKKDFSFSPAPMSSQIEGSKSRCGVLHLPKRYHSAYIIDGQHRLYGYSETDFAATDCIPVVAFVDLSGKQQLELFMDINENQKAVNKTLRTILNKDMFWGSDDKSEQRKAIQSKIAQDLGGNSRSPLLARVRINDDDVETNTRCITVEALQTAIARCAFLSEYGKKNVLKRAGTIDFDNIDKTADRLFDYLIENLRYIQTRCPEQWSRGKEGFLTINRGIQACIRVIDDITSKLVKEGKINPLKDDIEKMVTEVGFYLDPLCDYFNGMTDDQERELKNTYGTNGETKFYRYFQKQIADTYKDYAPEGLDVYFEDMSKKYNNDTRDFLLKIESAVRALIAKTLGVREDSKAWQTFIPKDILKRIHNEAYDKQLDGEDVTEWSLTSFKDFSDIATYSSNWSKFFDTVLTRPEDKGKGKKEEKLAWLDMCDSERAKIQKNPSYSVPRNTFDTIRSIYDWLCKE